MKLRNKTATPNIVDAVSRSVNFEVTVADIARRSERRAWFVASAAVLVSLILAGGYFYILPLKEKVPYLVMADAYTGTSTVARLSDDFTNRSIATSDAINRSNVAHFMLARESYDVALMNLRDWTTVYTMSSPGVASGYTNLHASSNPDAPYHLYGRSRAIRVKILSIVMIGGGNGTVPKGATVRFQRSLYDKNSGVTRHLDSKIATMEFAYNANLKMDEEDRIENPLGFQVTSYRVDNDYSASPPVELELQRTLSPPEEVPSAASANDNNDASMSNAKAADTALGAPAQDALRAVDAVSVQETTSNANGINPR